MTPENYVDRVSFELHDLPWRTRRDLVSELRTHLDELPAGTDLAARLGPPEQYAADLRAAAGLERGHGPIAFLRARRPRNLVITLVLLAVIGLAIGAVVWIETYQPLAFAGGGIEPAGAVEAPAGDSASLVYRQGRPFQLGTTVQNTGRFTVRVTGVPESAALPVFARLMMSGPLENFGVHPPYTRFHPFDLKPGESRLLFFEGIGAKCRWKGVTSVESALAVRFSFLWRTATAYIPLSQPLAIRIPYGTSCR